MSCQPPPPSGAVRLFRWTAPPGGVRDAMLGDLQEEYTRHAADHGVAVARSWYWTQVAGSVFPLLRFRLRRSAFSKALAATLAGSCTVVLATVAVVPITVWLLGALDVPVHLRPLAYLVAICGSVGAGGYVAATRARARPVGPVFGTSVFSAALLVLLFVASPEPEPAAAWLLWLPAVVGTSWVGASLRTARP